MEHLVADALLLVFLITFIRALPLPEAWLKRKPLTCDACMTGWALLLRIAILVLAHKAVDLPYLFGVSGLALLGLAWLRGQQAFQPPEG